MLTRTLALTLSTLGAGVMTAPASAQTIADVVASSGGEFDQNWFDYDMLLNAVVAADLVGPLADPDAELTVFAPNDLAFIRLARTLGYEGRDESGAFEFIVSALTDLGGGDPIPLLTDVLLYHVVDDEINAFEFILLSFFGVPVETLQGGTFLPRFLFLVDNEPDLPNPTLFFPLNLQTDNGIIHTISRVLIPVDLP
ncbi:MAG: fasciclin domain-containing protein [Phycisphaerae bacterium]|nr:fasciclin domain-containing protein [Phycisphaerae bacterium]NNF41997.1 fasciclin domain-containing protein [Phycisphaerales bacterium]